MSTSTRVVSVIAGSVVLMLHAWAMAGPLVPPSGPIVSTGKTLTDIEPRIAINGTNTPGDADALFRITQPGSYYLTGNIDGVVGKHGIEIASDAVTIDLNGFTLQGVADALSGVKADGVRSLIGVKNGIVGGWQVGLNLTLVSGEGVRVSDVIVSGNLMTGIAAPAQITLTNCQVLNTLLSGAVGISAGTNSVLENCTVSTTAGIGIIAGRSSTLSGCVATSNAGAGFSLGEACVISNSVARGNTGTGISGGNAVVIKDCSAISNGADGIRAGLAGTLSGCTSSFNTGDGIDVNGACTVFGNTCRGNGAGAGSGAGIRVQGPNNRIEGNNCTSNDRGIEAAQPGSIIIGNTCGGNGVNWELVANNNYGPIVDRTAGGGAAVSGNSAASSLGPGDPNANFSY